MTVARLLHMTKSRLIFSATPRVSNGPVIMAWVRAFAPAMVPLSMK